MEPLQIELVHLYPQENSDIHHTAKFELVHSEPAIAVLRRGQAFSAVVRFSNRGYSPDNDIVQLIFSIGEQPHPIKRTQGNVTVQQEDPAADVLQWSAFITSQTDDTISLEIKSPCDAAVGAWSLRVVTKLNEDPTPVTFDFEDDIYILFNPWNKDDQVYMEDTELLEEYVNNDVGKVWVGPMGSAKGRPWVFGQFDAVVLPACLLMLDRAEVAFSQRGDPVKITRILSQIVNSNDDHGVLVGRWDGVYDEGTAPAAWTGSVAILQQFLETHEEVNFGQCWVFAGVVTTACRALGIPSRVVTNFVSAHDANESLTVDKYYTADMEELEVDPTNPMGEDSIWNYHVWNDVWMARPDLPLGYGGWQAVDATPQEKSAGLYQCGPASLEAIRQGAVGMPHDVSFMLASVNADLMRWKEDPASDLGYSRIDTNKNHIGKMILTKKPYIFDPIGEADRHDITMSYKNKEGSEAERLSLYNGVRGSERAKRFYAMTEDASGEVEFQIEELELVKIGDDFNVTVNIKNNSSETKEVKAVLRATTVFYTGVKAHVVKKAEGKFMVGAGDSEKAEMTVTADEYLPHLVEYCNMKLSAICSVQNTNQTWAGEDDFQIVKPTIDIKFSDDAILGQQVMIALTFVNPLHKRLTNCVFSVSGPGLVKRTLAVQHDEVPPRGIVLSEVPITPLVAGSKQLIVTFNSVELVDVTGSATVEVFDE